MTREWKPGDVVDVGVEVTHRAMRTKRTKDGREGWLFDDGSAWDGAGPLRPLVVIDPEDREQVERLRECFTQAGFSTAIIQAALRDLIDPPPEVFAHYPAPHQTDSAGLIVQSLCGKTWKPVNRAEDCDPCPECVELVASGWIA